jgi:hypothetical protein
MPPPPPPPAPAVDMDPPVSNSALLKSIQKGTKLKKVETNDRSAPTIEGIHFVFTPKKRRIQKNSFLIMSYYSSQE